MMKTLKRGSFALSGWRSLSEQAKAQHPDALVMFKCGDFYEIFGEDAVATADAAGLTISRAQEAATGCDVERAGIPCHAIDRYVRHLVERGYSVAILEEDEAA